MYCIHCGGEIGDDALFCSKCGEKVVRRQFDQQEAFEAPPKKTTIEEKTLSSNAQSVNRASNKSAEVPKADDDKREGDCKAERQQFINPETAKEIAGKIGSIKDGAVSLGRKKLALIIALVATIAFWGGGFLSSYLPGLLNQVLLVIWIGGVIASIIMIRHNPLKDFGKAWRLFQGFGLIGLFLSYFAVCIVLILGLVFPIVPVGLEYLQNKNDM